MTFYNAHKITVIVDRELEGQDGRRREDDGDDEEGVGEVPLADGGHQPAVHDVEVAEHDHQQRELHVEEAVEGHQQLREEIIILSF